jgi:penicillin V acylase-like amidase (Ntn superfamily)
MDRSFRSVYHAALMAFALGTMGPLPVEACSRITWVGPNQQVITGRSMDWPYGFQSHFHVIPRRERLDGAGGLNSLVWTSRYGTVVGSGSTSPGGSGRWGV